MKYAIVVAFALMCVAQWFVPLKMITDSEEVLSEGKLYKFKTAPVDPSDPFRGKYITLYFEEDRVRKKYGEHWNDYDPIYVILKQDKDGYARIKEGTKVKPAEGTDYFKTKISSVYTADTFNIEFPFDRFYLEESKASEAEKLYWQNRGKDSCYAIVYVKDGEAVLKDVVIGEKSIVEIVKELNEN